MAKKPINLTRGGICKYCGKNIISITEPFTMWVHMDYSATCQAVTYAEPRD